jgi:hypothetical protein
MVGAIPLIPPRLAQLELAKETEIGSKTTPSTDAKAAKLQNSLQGLVRLSRLRLRTSSYVGHVSFRLRPVRQAQGYGGQVDDYRPT